jgi:hypothetical protein
MAGSRFASHLKWWFFLVPLLALFVMPAIPDRSMFSVPPEEADSVQTVAGVERADEVVALTNARFRRWFVDSGIIRATLDASGSGEIGEAGVSEFAHGWVHNFWLEIYRVIYRASVMKASAAGFASPLSFHLAGHGILLVFGVAFAVLAAPFPVLAQYWIAVAAILGALLWKAASSFQ